MPKHASHDNKSLWMGNKMEYSLEKGKIFFRFLAPQTDKRDKIP